MQAFLEKWATRGLSNAAAYAAAPASDFFASRSKPKKAGAGNHKLPEDGSNDADEDSSSDDEGARLDAQDIKSELERVDRDEAALRSTMLAHGVTQEQLCAPVTLLRACLCDVAHVLARLVVPDLVRLSPRLFQCCAANCAWPIVSRLCAFNVARSPHASFVFRPHPCSSCVLAGACVASALASIRASAAGERDRAA